MNEVQQQVETASREVFGTVPPMIAQMMQVSPVIAFNYVQGIKAYASSGFTDIEKNAIQLRISVLNGCASCVKGHSFLLKRAGMAEEDILAVRHGLLTSDPSLNRLLDATVLLFEGGREAFGGTFREAFARTGVSERVAVEIIGLLSLKTISNYFNNFYLQVTAHQSS